MGKRKNPSPLQKANEKTPRGEPQEEISVDEQEKATGGTNMEDLKRFITQELARTRKEITEEVKKEIDTRISAVEDSLNFALTANEVISQRLSKTEKNASETKNELQQCQRRLRAVEDQLDSFEQEKLLDWLVFSGPAIPKLTRNDRPEDAPRLLHDMLLDLLGFRLDCNQVKEVHRDRGKIWVRFSHSFPGSNRDQIFRGKTRLRGTGLFVREKITARRQSWCDELMKLKHRGLIRVVSTRSGTVFCMEANCTRFVPIQSEEALQRLLHRLTSSSQNTNANANSDSEERQIRPAVESQNRNYRPPGIRSQGEHGHDTERREERRLTQSFYSPPLRVYNEPEQEGSEHRRERTDPDPSQGVRSYRDREERQEQRQVSMEHTMEHTATTGRSAAQHGAYQPSDGESARESRLRSADRCTGLRRRAAGDIRSFCAPNSVHRKND